MEICIIMKLFPIIDEGIRTIIYTRWTETIYPEQQHTACYGISVFADWIYIL